MSELTKWPRLLVTGEPVTREQANDILIRTNHWGNLCTNDRGWEAIVERVAAECLGRPKEPDNAVRSSMEHTVWVQMCQAHWRAHDEWEKWVGILDLHYLNNSQIVSSYIGGPHGWCGWDGRIGCSTYNIGKWPTIDEVGEDLTLIAKTWPFLTMHVQLLAEEGDGDPLVTWAVRDGNAEPVEQAELITEPRDDLVAAVFGVLYDPFRERRVTVERLHEALTQVADSRREAMP